jgi:hypothetical protein
VLDHGGQWSVSMLTARRGSGRETAIGVRNQVLASNLHCARYASARPGRISSAPRATERLSCVVPAAPHAARTVLVSRFEEKRG